MNNNLVALRERAKQISALLNEIKHKCNNRWYFDGVRIGRDLKTACLEFSAPDGECGESEFYDFPPQCLYDTVKLNSWFNNKTAQIMAEVRAAAEKEQAQREKWRLEREEQERQQYLALKARFGE